MKRTLLFIAGIVLTVCMVNCKKSKSYTNTAYCTSATPTLIAHVLDTDSVAYFMPNAFTPNGDGLNDIFGLFDYSGLVADSSTITIWNLTGTEEYTAAINATRWDGYDMTGKKCAAGVYPLHLHLLTNKGAKIDICSSVTVFTGSCISGSKSAYLFPDEIAPDSGFVFQTNDIFCP